MGEFCELVRSVAAYSVKEVAGAKSRPDTAIGQMIDVIVGMEDVEASGLGAERIRPARTGVCSCPRRYQPTVLILTGWRTSS